MSNDILTVAGLTGLAGCQEPRDDGRDVVCAMAARYRVTHMIFLECERFTWRPWVEAVYKGKEGDFVLSAELHLAAPHLGIRGVRIYRFRPSAVVTGLDRPRAGPGAIPASP